IRHEASEGRIARSINLIHGLVSVCRSDVEIDAGQSGQTKIADAATIHDNSVGRKAGRRWIIVKTPAREGGCWERAIGADTVTVIVILRFDHDRALRIESVECPLCARSPPRLISDNK